MSPILLSSADETAALAVQLGAKLQVGDVLLLEGDIGAGKTHFARSLIQSLLKIPEDVPSPTFTLVQMYEIEHSELWHTDLYRLTSPDEIVELGLIDAFEDAICLVEWPDRLAELRPDTALTLNFALGETPGSRILTPTYTTPRWESVLGALSYE
ncbi:tRNA threonylcarbamoyladenosine biosynthesis protein TsaE [Shimia sp. SK013]|uniref:tRNA (adenosine(37)-N6)-threonylcarbamoyltransferase complex ATPase subunit type 1 TsaE n=1 Tax=Shimia sp. SK013 TaxID=1389006 RepID=UPI0006B546E4|nr:tRNA (adenosine(37)-N6)-threonylcarbamoyltransferase complex ATPase subunit type 1 TsaE [Shimia sp. SK013]KPA19860.1 tRNA threonylcarbamoyladenosine biosynthesis protein TsaE [Shimia sp. SK013]